MTMEVGRIRAVVSGDTADFDKKMAAAQKTFTVTAQKLDASAQQVANSLKKTYSERVIAANAAASKEIEAAQRSMRERLRASTNSAEVSAVKAQFAQRANAARAGARAEIQAAQQQYMAASQGMRPIITATETLTKTAVSGRSSVFALRGAVTAMAASSLSAAPGVTQLSAVLGSMALGAPVMIGVLAGMAALGLAWKKIAGNAKEAKEEQEKAIEAARKIRMGPLGTEIEQKQAAETLRDNLLAKLATERQGRRVTILDDKGSVTETIINQAAIRKLEADLAQAEAAVKTFQGVITKHNTESQTDAAEAASRAADAAVSAAKEFEKWRVIVKDLDEEMGHMLTSLELVTGRGIQLNARGTAPAPGLSGTTTKSSPLPVSVELMSDTVLKRWASSVKIAAAQRDAGRGIIAGVGANLKETFGKEGREKIAVNLATGLISGGVSTFVGAAANFATGLLTHAKRAKEALRLHMEAVNEWDRSLRAAIASLRGETEKARTFAAIDDITQMFRDLNEKLGMDFGAIPVFDTMDQLVEWLKKQQALVAKLKDAFPFLNFDEFSSRLDQLIKYAAELGISLGDTAKAAKSATESMTNVPAGFKVALARFQATAPAFPASSLPTLPPPSTVNAGGGGGGTQTSTRTVNIETVIVNGVEDLPDFIEKLEVEVARKVARGGSGLSLGYL